MLALSYGLRLVGLPVQNLAQEFLCELIPLVDLVDNQQAVTAVERVYSKKLRCVYRTRRIAIGLLHEIVGDMKQLVEIDTSNPICRRATSTLRPWHPRSLALSGFSLGCSDPAKVWRAGGRVRAATRCFSNHSICG